MGRPGFYECSVLTCTGAGISWYAAINHSTRADIPRQLEPDLRPAIGRGRDLGSPIGGDRDLDQSENFDLVLNLMENAGSGVFTTVTVLVGLLFLLACPLMCCFYSGQLISFPRSGPDRITFLISHITRKFQTTSFRIDEQPLQYGIRGSFCLSPGHHF